MLQSSLCLNKRQEEILQLKTSIINQKKLYCDGNDFYIIHPEIRLIEKLPKGNELVRFFNYKANRGNFCRRCEYINKLEFIEYVEKRFFNDGISVDAYPLFIVGKRQ